MFDMLIHSRDTRDQSRKLSEIAPKFGRLLALPNFWGRAFQKLYPHYHPSLVARGLETFCEDSQDTPTSPEVEGTHSEICGKFKFLPLFFFFGGGRPRCGVR